MRRNVVTRLTAGLGLVVFLGSCATTSSTTSFELAEFSISGPRRLAADATSIGVANSGEFDHTLVVTNEQGDVVAATDLIGPGEKRDLQVELSAGPYSFTCRIVIQGRDGVLVDHYEAGMNTKVTVTG